MTPFFTRLSDRAVQTYFYLFVPTLDAGYYFPTSTLPLAPLAGTTVVPCLDITAMRTMDATLTRKAGVAATKTLNLQLGPNNSEILTTVLATTGANAGLRVEGLLAYLVMGLADHSGVPLDTDYWSGPGSSVPDYQCVVFAGPIESCQMGASWYHWDVQILSLEAMLDTEIGAEVAGTLTPWGVGESVQSLLSGVPISTGRNRVDFTYTPNITGLAAGTVNLTAYPTYINAAGVAQAMATAINTWLTANGKSASCDSDVLVAVNNDPQGFADQFVAGKFRWKFALYYRSADTTFGLDDLSEIVMDPQAPCSVLPYLGYVEETSWSFGISQFGSSSGGAAVAQDLPYVLWMPPTQTSVEIWFDDGQPTPPDSGYLRFTDGERAEIAGYYQRSGGTAGNGRTRYTFALTDSDGNSRRGLLGTSPLDVRVTATVVEVSAGDFVIADNDTFKARVAAAVEDKHLFDVFGLLATNDGDPSTPWRDATQPAGFCGSLSYQDIDTAKIQALALTNSIGAPFATRSYAWTEPGNLREWLSQELQGVGWTLQARTCRDSAQYLLTLDNSAQATQAPVWAITSADLIQSGAVQVDHVTSGVVNRAVAELTHDLDGSDQELKATVNYTGSQVRLKRVLKEDYKIRGIDPSQWSPDAIGGHFLGLLAPYAYPYELVVLPLRRQHWQVQPGDTVSLTLAGLPKPTGGRGWTAEPLVVIGVERVLAPNGDEAPCVLTCLHAPDRRLSYYSPSARVASWNAGTLTLTVEANAFSTAGTDWILDPTKTTKDILWFADATSIQVTQAGDDSSTEPLAVVSVSTLANRFVLTAAPTFAPVAGDLVTLATWDLRATSEKRFVAIADGSGTLGTANDPAFNYGG